MILAAAMMLAAPGAATRHCADPAFCPSLAEFTAAVQAWHEAQFREIARTLADEGLSIQVTRNPILRIAGIYCGEPEASAASINCQAILEYRNGRSFAVMRLTRGDGWVVDESRDVFHPAKR